MSATPKAQPMAESRPVLLPACLLAVPVLAVETAIAWALVTDQAGASVLLAAHLGLSAVLAAVAYGLVRRSHDARLAAWLAWMTLTLGPLGPIATIILAIMTGGFVRVARPFEEWYAGLFPEDEETASERLYQRIVSGREDSISEGSVSSLTDVLFTGNTRAKQAVVALLARRFRSDFAPALQMALNDPEASIRVQAATAASTIEERFHNRRLELEAEARQNPNRDTVLSLARHLDEYAYAGVLDEDRQQVVMAEALANYQKAAGFAADEDVQVAIGRLLLRLDRLEEAETLLSDLAGSSQDDRPVLWLVECLFRQRRFDELRRHIDDPRLQDLALTEGFSALSPVVNLWQVSALVALNLDLDLPEPAEEGA